MTTPETGETALAKRVRALERRVASLRARLDAAFRLMETQGPTGSEAAGKAWRESGRGRGGQE